MSEIITFAPVTASGEAEFIVPFPYLQRDHVKLYINGVEDTNKEWLSDGALKASVSVNAGDICVVRRETPRSALITTLPTTGTLQSDDVNEQSLQAVYVATEAADGLREGLALDEATETYWEGAPTGVNRIIKNVVDPSAAQEAATKGWYDQQLIDHAANAATSASNASGSASSAGADAATAVAQAAAATASATAAAASESTAATNSSTTSTAATTASNAAAEAEAWANTAVSTEVLYDNPNPINDAPSYSAKHWAAQAATDETTATAANTLAQAIAAAADPVLSSTLLGNEEGWAVNWRGLNISVTDYDGSVGITTNAGLPAYCNANWGSTWAAANDYANFDKQRKWSDYGTPQFEFHPSINLPDHPAAYQPFGVTDCRSDVFYGYSAAEFASGSLSGSVNNVTRANNTTHPEIVPRGTNHTRLTMAVTGGSAEFWGRGQLGRSGLNIPAGYKPYVHLVMQYGNWDHFKVELDLASNSNTYLSGTIDLNGGGTPTASAGNFTRMRIDKLPWGWWSFIFEVPPQLSDTVFSTDGYKLYFTDSSGNLSHATGGAGTEYVDVGYYGVHRNASIFLKYNGLVGGAYPGIAAEPGNGADLGNKYPMANMTTTNANGMTMWANCFLTGTLNVALAATEQYQYICGLTGLGQGVIVWWRPTTGNLELFINSDGTLAASSIIVLDNFTPDDFDNDTKGTQVQVVCTWQNDVYDVYWRINQGATQSYTHTETTNNVWSTSIFTNDWAAFYNDNGAQFNGTRRYNGCFTRRITSSEAARYLNYT